MAGPPARTEVMTRPETSASTLTLRQVDSLAGVDPARWNRLVDPDNPFFRHEFLHGLERHNCLEPQGWSPCHLLVEDGAAIVGAMPLYLRSNSYGEFVFDWAWADAFERAGGR